MAGEQVTGSSTELDAGTTMMPSVHSAAAGIQNFHSALSIALRL